MLFRLVDAMDGVDILGRWTGKESFFEQDMILRAWERITDTDGDCDLWVMRRVGDHWEYDKDATSHLLYKVRYRHMNEYNEYLFINN